MLIKALLVLAAAVVVLLVVGATRPDDYVVTRATTIRAPAALVASYIDDFHRWPAWSPWEQLDPDMKRTLNDVPRGPGATYGWVGNSKAGAGQMKVLASRPDGVDIELVFVKPFPQQARIDFAFAPDGAATRTTWTMHGKKGGLLMKVFCLFMDMDKLVGKDFERGLAQLKGVVEAAPVATK